MSSKNQKAQKKAPKAPSAEASEIVIQGTPADVQAALLDVKAPPAAGQRKTMRGRSTIESPVDQTWAMADDFFRRSRDAGEPKPRRKDVVQACIDHGIAPYTARTQYQAWFKHTLGGTRLMADGNVRPIKVAKPEADEDAE